MGRVYELGMVEMMRAGIRGRGGKDVDGMRGMRSVYGVH